VLEGVHFALFGRLPSRYAATNQAVGELFGESGLVEFEDTSDKLAEDPVWIRRKLTRSGAAVSVKVDTSDSTPGSQSVDDGRWAASNAFLLDFEAFEKLKPAEKGKYILELCHKTTGSKRDDIMGDIRKFAAIELGGPDADAQFFRKIQDHFRQKEIPIAERCAGSGGTFELLSTHIDERDRPSVVCLRLLAEAKEQLAMHQSAIRDGKKTLEKLKEGASVQLPRDADVAREERRVTRFKERAIRARAANERFQIVSEKLPEAEVANERALEALKSAQEKYSAALERARDVPKAPEEPVGLKDAMREAKEANGQVESLASLLAEAEVAAKKVDVAQKAVKDHADALKAYEGNQAFRLFALIDDLPDDLYETIPAIKGAAQGVRHSFDREKKRLEGCLEESNKNLKGAAKALARYGDLEAKTSQLAGLRKDAKAAEAKHASIMGEFDLAKREHAKALEAHEEVVAASREAEDAAVRARGAVEGARGALVNLTESVRGARSDRERKNKGEMKELEEALEEAEGVLKTYQEATIIADEYKKIADDLAYGALDVEAWRLMVSAIEETRNLYLSEAAGTLLEKANEIYRQAFPRETIKIVLETPTGKTTCQFELHRDGVVIKDKALSVGEWCLVLSAFSLAASLRSSGRRILLIEAQALDRRNIARLLHMLTAKGPSLVLVASTISPEEMPEAGQSLPLEWVFIPVEKKVDQTLEALDEGRLKVRAEEAKRAVSAKDWYNEVIRPKIGSAPCARLSKKLKREIALISEKFPNWMTIVQEGLEKNPAVLQQQGITLSWFANEANLIDWMQGKAFASVPREGDEMPGTKAPF
jgi:hypothetical protein